MPIRELEEAAQRQYVHQSTQGHQTSSKYHNIFTLIAKTQHFTYNIKENKNILHISVLSRPYVDAVLPIQTVSISITP